MIGSMSLHQLAEALQGELRGEDVRFSAVSTDTRTLRAGDLYIALRGEHFDGNAFVGQAREQGACAAMVEVTADDPLTQLRVADTRQALADLAVLNRRRAGARRFALTGSQGKTSVKEMCGRIMALHNEVLITRGNLNNEIGVPLMLLELEERHALAVFELGANAAGEIAGMVQLVAPEIVLITNAAETHLEGFGSLDGVVRAKGEIIDGLSAEGTVILNADDPAWSQWKERAAGRVVKRFTLSGDRDAAYRAVDIRYTASGSHFVLRSPSGDASVRLPLPGKHNVANALAAAALCHEAGVSLDDICTGLAAMQAVPGRLVRLSGVNGSLLIDDSYNASPSSFRAAIEVLITVARDEQRRSILIAGDMAELGDASVSLHQQLGHDAEEAGVSEIWAIGQYAQEVVRGRRLAARAFDSMDALAVHASENLTGQDVALIKGSRSAGMQVLVDELKQGEHS